MYITYTEHTEQYEHSLFYNIVNKGVITLCILFTMCILYCTRHHLHHWYTVLSRVRVKVQYRCCRKSKEKLDGGVTHRVHKVAMATFLRTFHHDGKICSAWWGCGCALHLSLYLPSQAQLWWCTLQLRGQRHFPYFSSTSICTLWCKPPPPSRLTLFIQSTRTVFHV